MQTVSSINNAISASQHGESHNRSLHPIARKRQKQLGQRRQCKNVRIESPHHTVRGVVAPGVSTMGGECAKKIYPVNGESYRIAGTLKRNHFCVDEVNVELKE